MRRKFDKAKTQVRVLKYLLAYSVVAISFITMFHYNVVLEYLTTPNHYSYSEGIWFGVYDTTAGSIIEYSTRIGLATTWKMYSSGRRTTFWIDWYVQNQESKWILYDTPNHSPSHRASRSLQDGFLFDFKIAIMQMQLSDRNYFREKYGQYVCKTASEVTGWEPLAVRAKMNIMPKLPNDEKGNFSLLSSPVQEEKFFDIQPCGADKS